MSAIVAHLSNQRSRVLLKYFPANGAQVAGPLIVCVAIFMLLLDITIVNVALPSIQRDLRTSFTDLQWVVDAYALLLATSVLNAGTLGDWLGRKRVFIGGVALFTLASAHSADRPPARSSSTSPAASRGSAAQ